MCVAKGRFRDRDVRLADGRVADKLSDTPKDGGILPSTNDSVEGIPTNT